MNIDVLKLVGSRIRDIRKSKGLTQSQVGDRAGFDYTYIGKMETGSKNISLNNLVKIADALDVGIHEFFSYIFEYGKIGKKDRLVMEIMALVVQKDEDKLITARNVLKEILKD